MHSQYPVESQQWPSDLRPLIGSINADQMRAMNFQVDEGQEQPRKVANDFLQNRLPPTE